MSTNDVVTCEPPPGSLVCVSCGRTVCPPPQAQYTVACWIVELAASMFPEAVLCDDCVKKVDA